MAEPAKKSPRIEKPAEIVYRRVQGTGELPAPSEPLVLRTREIAPAITPLISGFLLLLALIALLAWLSVQKMTDVSFQARDLEQQYSARLRLLLNLRLALTKLDNEARIKLQAESRRELAPPFDLRLDSARDEVNNLVHQLDSPPLSESAPWQQFRNDLQAYVEVTGNLRAYSLEGFTKFRTV